jgi:hypothetical protein
MDDVKGLSTSCKPVISSADFKKEISFDRSTTTVIDKILQIRFQAGPINGRKAILLALARLAALECIPTRCWLVISVTQKATRLAKKRHNVTER